MPGKNLKFADAFAPDYDSSIANNHWNGPQILFELLAPQLQPKSSILDLGIGTGESSMLFSQSGHYITGLDGSEKMLGVCKKKNIAEKLVLHDLEKPPLPFNKKCFNAVISNGVFHLIHPLKPIFCEVARILTSPGYFVFTYENTSHLSRYLETENGIWENTTDSGVLTFKHSDKYIEKQLASNQFELIRTKQFLAFRNTELKKDFYFTAVLAQR